MSLEAFAKCYYEKVDLPVTRKRGCRSSISKAMSKGPSQYLTSGRPAIPGASTKDQFSRGVHFDALDHYELAQIAAGQGNEKAAMSHLQQANSIMRMSPQQHLDQMKQHEQMGNGGDHEANSNGHLDAAHNHAYLYGVKTGDWKHYSGDAEQADLDRAHQQYKFSGHLTGLGHVNPVGLDS